MNELIKLDQYKYVIIIITVIYKIYNLTILTDVSK